ncbi:MAG TPA: DNA polymerase II large subunit [Candidatus Deferrimicrobium sp.]|nr:DNA polymerase II large subunit [Candidatus Deferrimicrobium sp.]
MQECSEKIQEYFTALKEGITRIYDIAKKARTIGIDPTNFPEIFPAMDLASRVEALLGPKGVANRIRLFNEKQDREETAFKIAEEIVNGKYMEWVEDKEENGKYEMMEKDEIAALATRVALSILTGGITAAPLEGISDVKIRENFDRTRYLAIYFAGPIRSAGGTEAALAVLVGDWVRTLLKLDKYKPINKEVERYVEEVQAYKREVNLQYPSSSEEIRAASMNIPVEITGEPTETVEVSGYRDLKRVETNKLRGGACLVLNDGIIGKAHKLKRIVEKLKITGWDWLENLQAKKSSENEESEEKIPPKYKFIAKVITGRPVFAYPSKVGGFRVRYGRSRNTGFAAVGLNPSTMFLLDNFLVPGTQFITERPGKGSIVLPVDSIEGPIVQLKGGQVLQINTVQEAHDLKDKVEKFIYLGDCLIGFGEFLENGHILIPAGYCEEWWSEELRFAIEKMYADINASAKDLSISLDDLKGFIENPFFQIPNEEQTLLLSSKLQIPIHPKYNLFWGSVSDHDLIFLQKYLKAGIIEQNPPLIKCNYELRVKELLEKLGIPHKLHDNQIILSINIKIIKEIFALDTEAFEYTHPTKQNRWKGSISTYAIRDRAPYYIGGRMGRPEKAKGREFFHILFPVGIAGGNRRSLIKASEAKKVNVEITYRECPQCGIKTFLYKCAKCNKRTVSIRKCSQLNCQTKTEEEFCPRCGNITRTYEKRELPIKKLLLNRLTKLNEPMPKEIKGVKGLMSQGKTPEILEKGILRAKYNLFTYRDGTIRFDATDAPLTHFSPIETGVSISQLKDLGYTHDYLGAPLTTQDQILELKVQDIVVPIAGAEFLIKVANFIDDLLVKVYNLDPFYKISKKEELIGHLVIGLAPHISAGVVGRIIGFTTAKLCYAHPYWHSAKRRNCDGDEDTIILGLDAVLNFSRSYLPQKRGGMMDAPLVLTSQLNPSEIDDEVYNMEVGSRFPIDFYEKTLEYEEPKKIQKIIDIVDHRIGYESQFEGFSFTHPTSNINTGPEISRYKELKSVREKVYAQLELAVKTEAADAQDEARRLLHTHFIPDIIGNLRSFATQKFRCIKCNTKYRRLPLANQCLKCGGKIILTVTEGGITKYLGLSLEIVDKYKLDTYTKQRLLLAEDYVDSIFTSDKGRQLKLDKF